LTLHLVGYTEGSVLITPRCIRQDPYPSPW